MKKLLAFTLTEVLITMSIIGVISALTVPTLMNNYQKKTQVVQLRKVINDISNAIDMYITEEGKTKFSATPYYSDLDKFVTSRLKYVKTCAKDASGCFASENYLPIGNGDAAAFKCAGKSYVLANSAAICITKNATNNIITVNIDVNGIDGPNIGGRDMFEFYVNSAGEVVYCSSGGNTCDTEKSGCTGSAIGKGCAQTLAENAWIMDY